MLTLTAKSLILKEHTLREYACWSMSSQMPQVYLHYFGNESSKSLLEAYGIEDYSNTNEKANVLKSKSCPHCNEPNKPDSRFCFKCKMVLTFDSYKETLERQNEKDEQIKILTSRLDEYVDAQREGRIMSKKIAKRFIEIEKKFNDLMGVKKKERKYNREFELESDPVTKDDKFDRVLETTRERIKRQGELEQQLQKYTTT